jgi:hypothetical protein
MAHSNQTIHDMFDVLQKRFGAFREFEDVPASVLDAEKASEARFDELAKIMHEAAA